VFQGSLALRRYFEGWYFKLVFAEEHLALIPGISLAPEDRHAFIQVIRSGQTASAYHRFSQEQFSAARKPFSLRVGGNSFSLEDLEIALPDVSLSASLSELARWPQSVGAPNTMGWYAYVPFMECNHAVLVLDGRAEAVLDGTRRRGRIYIEKDFGRSFPSAWVWLQSNSFEKPGVSVTASVARVPFLRRSLTGVLAGVLVDGEIYRFANYTGVQVVQMELSPDRARLALRSGENTLEIQATGAAGAPLRAPVEGRMSGSVTETIDAEVSVHLARGSRTIFSGVGTRAGFEAQNIEEL
jgi:hypothetical protein